MSVGPSSAEDAYRAALEHWLGCVRCSAAGGENASLWDMCRPGRALSLKWARAERRERKDRASKRGAVNFHKEGR